jgi:hypothetical protein
VRALIWFAIVLLKVSATENPATPDTVESVKRYFKTNILKMDHPSGDTMREGRAPNSQAPELSLVL